MRLTSFTDYGLRALMRLASAPDQAFSTAELAQEFRLSRDHLTKIMQRLARGGIVATRRGGGGGAALARAPREIRLGDVVRLLEEGQALVEYFTAGGDCTIDGCCRLKARLRSAEAAFFSDLNRSTLADIALPAPALEPDASEDRLLISAGGWVLPRILPTPSGAQNASTFAA